MHDPIKNPEKGMKINRVSLTILYLSMIGLILSCSPSPTPASTPGPDTPTVASVATPIPATEELLPTPTEITPEPEETPDRPATSPAQPAAQPHFKVGEKLALDFVHMVSLDEGWALQGPYVLVTEDGGSTWREVTPPELFPEGILAQAYAAFANESTAWVVYGFDTLDSADPAYAYYQVPAEASVWATYDGGETWTPSPPLRHEIYGDSTWAELTSVDDITAWMMIRGVYVGAGTHYIAQLFRTEDGITWESLDADVGVDYTGMVFADEDAGWLTWQTTGAYAAAPPEVAITTDSGFNWDILDLPAPDDAPGLFEEYEYCEPYSPNLLSPESIRLLVACFGYSGPNGDTIRYVYSSNDSGESWEMSRVPGMPNSTYATLIFFDTENSLLLGKDLLQSSDGGETWELVKTVSWEGQFSFIDAQNGWAVARSSDEQIALVRTEDGGRTWSQLDPTVAR
jgi:photosystem II stability/assembly factor-like uncharacterized protein